MRPPTFKRLLGNLLHHQLNLILHTLVSQHIDRLRSCTDAPKGLCPDTLDKVQLLLAELLVHFCGILAAINILSLIHISEPTRRTPISYAVFCLKQKPSSA